MDQNTIIKFLQGELSEKESQKIQDWLVNSTTQEVVRKKLGNIWTNHTIQLKDKKPDFDKILSQVHHKINTEESALQQPIAEQHLLKRTIPLFYRIAVVLVIPLLLSSVLFFFSNKWHFNDYASIAERQLYTKPGTVTRIELPDGSKVWLNDGTTIRYPEKFQEKERRLFVDGEAYFEVKKDHKHPFIVENPMMNTVVTGTTFNLNAYSEDHYFEATLVEGKVHLEKDSRRYNLNPGQQVRYNLADGQVIKKKVNTRIYYSWIDGRLVMEDEPLGDAIKKLGRWYNVDFVIKDQDLNKYLLTATFKDEKLEQTLQNIAYALPVKFSVQERMVDNRPEKTVYIMRN